MSEGAIQKLFWENRSLFSDYFLSERLHQKKEWKEDVSASFQKILQIYSEKKKALPLYNEAQTEKEFIQPVLEEVLGFQFDVQHTEKFRGKINTPDYVCFGDTDSLKKAQQNRETRTYYTDALAITEAKYWMRCLDEKGISEKDLLTNVNPSFQIVNYLTATGLEWGILTNGSKWRLYSSKGRSRIDSYFEADLKQILDQEDEEQFRYFYLFFRKNAFLPDPQTGTSFLESVFEGSIEYGSRLEKKLKDLIFENIFLGLGRGFVEYRKEEANIREESAESLHEIYKGTLRLLYRLLFLLHAESRGLLPLSNKGYWQYSLMNIKRKIADRVDQDIVQSTRSFDLWNDIDSLFRIIDKGDPALNVPRYNGGLFRRDHPNNRFLVEHKISDHYLVPVLEKMTRETDPESGEKRFIDYKSLNVEQLGSIYEGLLEFHLRIANEKLAVVKEKGREVYKPEKEVKNSVNVIEKGELYLQNDKGERKATGSYYTPHYIVEYIVENTLGPVFEERAATFRNIMENLEPRYEEYGKLDLKIKEGDKSTRSHNRRKALSRDINIYEKRAVESLLSIKICDPAMGSGHFLKEATDKLAEKIIVLVSEFQENPISRMLDEVRTQILESLKTQNISIDAEEHLRDTNLIKRMVMKRSIYGVDLNPMAVELAKLSLWLDSFTVGAPLSFLDHHLRTGNSLIGTTVNEVKFTLELDEDSQIDIFGGPFAGLLTATELMRNVAIKTDATFGEVEESMEQFSEYEKAIAPYKKLLDLWLSKYFDNAKAIMLLRQYPEKVIAKYKGQKSDLKEQYEPILEEANRIAQDKEFFHWELEFPEVFVDLKKTKWLENPGFDVVVGNPPYDVLEKERLVDENPHKALSEYLKNESRYDAASGGKQNLFRPFLIRVKDLINNLGAFGQIIPLSILTDKSCSVTLNSLLYMRYDFEIQAFPQKDDPNNRVFPEAKLSTCILIGTALNSNSNIKVSRNSGRHIESNAKTYSTTLDELESIMDSLAIPLASNNEWEILKQVYLKIDKESLNNLVDLSRGEINQTIFRKYITEDNSKDELLKGSQIGVYHEHEPSQGSVEWFDNDLYVKENGTPKTPPNKRIALQRISGVDDIRRLTGTVINRKAHFADSLNSLASDDDTKLMYVLSLLNSRLLNWCFQAFSTNNNVSTGEIAALPIRKIDSDKFNPEKNSDYPKQLEKLYQSNLSDSFSEELLELVYQFINDKEEYRLPVIHDFLAFLADQMLKYNKEKQKLQSALDPFKFMNKGNPFKPFKTVFAEAIKYGQLFDDEIDLGKVHHDIEGLRLELQHPSDRSKWSDGSPTTWKLSILLKHRDPESDWADWLKDEDDNIVRTEQPVYRFELSDEEGRYWQQAFEVLGKFEHSSNFPGGKTRTTHEKLMNSNVPVFDESANIQPLIELRKELAEVEEKIEKTDWLIDQVVYRLYGLSEEEIGVVEGG